MTTFIFNGDSKKNAIHHTVGHYNKALAQVLLDNGIDINEPDHWGSTILALTAQRISQAKIDNTPLLNEYLEFESWLKSKGAK